VDVHTNGMGQTCFSDSPCGGGYSFTSSIVGRIRDFSSRTPPPPRAPAPRAPQMCFVNPVTNADFLVANESGTVGELRTGAGGSGLFGASRSGSTSGHGGNDIAGLAYYSLVHAAAPGVVEYVGNRDPAGYGLQVIVNHGNGIRTRYAHLTTISVSAGTRVGRGSEVGVMGYTGNAGYLGQDHVHFEVIVNGTRVDPATMLNSCAIP
jgi:murein DD-endopeptidase MepM/ murein hydrolase activator NlpD